MFYIFLVLIPISKYSSVEYYVLLFLLTMGYIFVFLCTFGHLYYKLDTAYDGCKASR